MITSKREQVRSRTFSPKCHEMYWYLILITEELNLNSKSVSVNVYKMYVQASNLKTFKISRFYLSKFLIITQKLIAKINSIFYSTYCHISI